MLKEWFSLELERDFCRIITRSEEETKKLGEKIAKVLPSKTVILLNGEIGCGKTVFVKGLARAFGIPEEEITSPTFTIVHEYENLAHVDLYRIEDPEEVGFSEVLNQYPVVVVEWGEKAKDYVKNFFVVEVKCSVAGDKRVFEIKPKEVCKKLLENKECSEK